MARIVTFRGKITALQPIFQTPFNGKSAGRSNETDCIKIRARNVMLANEGAFDPSEPHGDRRPLRSVVDVAVISGNTLRAMIRRNIASDIMEHFGEGKLDFNTLFLIRSGGTISDGAIDLRARQGFKESNVVVGLLGGAAPGLGIMDGKMSVSFAVPRVRELPGGNLVEHGMPDELLPWAHEIVHTHSFVRKDDLKEFSNLLYLDEEGIDQILKYDESLQKKKARKKGEVAEEEIANESATSRQMPYTIRYIVQGTEFTHEITLTDPTPVELGAIYSAFRRFSENPRIGGFGSKGFGKVNVEYIVRERNGRDSAPAEIGTLAIRENPAIGMSDFFMNDRGELAKYDAYIQSLKLEDIRVPKTKEKE